MQLSGYRCPSCGSAHDTAHGSVTSDLKIQVACPSCAYSNFLEPAEADYDGEPQPPETHALNSAGFAWNGHDVLALHFGETARFHCRDCESGLVLELTPGTRFDSMTIVEAAQFFNVVDCATASKNATIPDEFIPDGEHRIGGGPP